ncbi:hypothetical protein HanHA300_Chr14g0536111 [Helianthus annuus]|nr:hypothetical protein HanHA300_Chr14g0536111 [Helianthus annuus]KAJ0486831.1 hypothetical protein HanHA89_Chr14g0583901 [Helianthus annuus]KAJ0660964.1 hypothetical protein HanOQP8_Chr14g0543471 [Helianthus annuus]
MSITSRIYYMERLKNIVTSPSAMLPLSRLKTLSRVSILPHSHNSFESILDSLYRSPLT